MAASNDFELGELVAAAAETMTVPKLKELRAQSGEALGKWAFALELTRELTPVLLKTEGDGTVSLVDRALYVEDASGGYWTLKSGQPILDQDGVEIDRPNFEQVLAQTSVGGSTWSLEQAFSPSSRGDAVEYRAELPYLAEIIDGRAVIRDYGIRDPDGTWRAGFRR